MAEKYQTKTFKDSQKGVSVSRGLCKSCGLCIESCPKKCISWDKGSTGVYGAPSVKVDAKACIACEICQHICPDAAIKVEKKG